MTSFRPVFIIGPGRSGTTLLYKLLALHRDSGYISNYDARLSAWGHSPLLSRCVSQSYRLKRWSWFTDEGNAYTAHRSWPRKVVPTPVEGEALFARVGLMMQETHPAEVTTHLRAELARLQTVQQSTILVSKCTGNNMRIPTIAAACPEARYIVLLRDGRAVAHSLTRVPWWNNHPVWWADNKTPLDMEREGTAMPAIAAQNWAEEVRALHRGIEVVAKENVRTVRFEYLVNSPLEHMNDLLGFVGLRRCDRYEQTVRSLGIAAKPEAWRTWSTRELDMVMEVEGELLQQLNYV